MSQKILTCRSLLLKLLLLWLPLSIVACGMAQRTGELGTTSGSEQPEWVTELAYKQDVIETVGYSSEMELPELSLKRADNRAKTEMANILASVVKSSIDDSVKAASILGSKVIEVMHEEVTQLYANANVSGIVIVDHYIDPKTGLTYTLARLSRMDAIRDAAMKAKTAVGRNESLFDELALDTAIRSRLTFTTELMEATGYASIFGEKSEEDGFGDYEVAMKRAELNARAALARQVRADITNHVQEWLAARKSSADDSSTDLLFEDITKTFSDVKLEGSRIMNRHFGDDTQTAYARAVMDKAWIAREFSHAAAPALNRSGAEDLNKELDQIIHDGLGILMEKPANENVPENSEQLKSQNPVRDSSNYASESFNDWKWWTEPEKEGSYEGYFYGVGTGPSQGKSDKEALGRLAGYIGVHVTARVSEELRATQQDVQLWYAESTDIESDRDLYGVTYRHYDDGSFRYSLALVSKQLVRDTVEAVARYHLALEALSDENVSEVFRQTLAAARLLHSPGRTAFPIRIGSGRSLKAELESLTIEALDRINVKLDNPSGTERYEIQLYTKLKGRNLVGEKIVYRFIDENGLTIDTKTNFTGDDGRSSVKWSGENGSVSLEVVPQFIQEIENSFKLGSATERLRPLPWGKRVRQDTEDIMNLWEQVQRKMSEANIQMGGEKLHIAIELDKEIYREGEKLDISFKANQDCHLVLCNIPVAGPVRLIFPNDQHSESFIKGNKKYWIPDKGLGHDFAFYIDPPFGRDRLYAFASTWHLNDFIQEIRKRNGEVGSIKDMVKGLEKSSTKSIEEQRKGIGVAPAHPDSGPPLKYAHDWLIFTSVGGE
ncbi:DUF4384 domain-containing protein [Candidatus Poribacteria bacterium]